MPHHFPDSTTSPEHSIPANFKLFLKHHVSQDYINQVAWGPDGETLAIRLENGTIELFDMKNEQRSRSFESGLITGYSMVWSPDGFTLALANSYKVLLIDAKTGKRRAEFEGHRDVVNTLAWSPNMALLASGSDDRTLRLWNTNNGQTRQILDEHSDAINCVAWSPDGSFLASGSSDGTLLLWNPNTGEVNTRISVYPRKVLQILFSPNGKALATLAEDETIDIWSTVTGRKIRSLEGHSGRVISASCSSDGRLLASKAQDGAIFFWHCDTWNIIATLQRPAEEWWSPVCRFHPTKPQIVTLGEKDTALHFCNINIDQLLNATTSTPSHSYANAKVVLVGDTGVGKSALGLVLTDQSFVPTDSTHGRRVWVFDRQDAELANGQKETHETLLWDLAGQPGYRSIHQLYLGEVALALIVFDARNETDPFASVRYWDRALRQAQRSQVNPALPMKKFLIAARTDRGGKPATEESIQAIMKELHFDGYFETSAKEGMGIVTLISAIHNALDWESLPKVSSTELFQEIKDFLLTEKETGQVLPTFDGIYRRFLATKPHTTENAILRTQFETCLGSIESRGLIRRLSFGSFILLQPEILDTYAAALVNAAKEEPNGLGSITEERAQAGNFLMPTEIRLKDKDQERLLLIAMVEDLIRHEIALRESADDGPYLVFPAQSTRERADLPDPAGKVITFSFEGPTLNIYSTLAVRLAHSGMFEMQALWKDAMTYTARAGGTCGMFLRNKGEGQGELTLFFSPDTSEQTRFHFEEYIYNHLQRRALAETIHRARIFTCPVCGEVVTDSQVVRRRERGFNTIKCNVCDADIPLLDREKRLAVAHQSLILEMDYTANKQRELSATSSVRQGVQGAAEATHFDVFLCHNSKDKPWVKEIGFQLKARGIRPWLDEWELRPGLPWQDLLEKQIGQIASAAVFVGIEGIGPWEHLELMAFLREFADRSCPVIPVILPNTNTTHEPQLPIFLKNMTWVDFRQKKPEPLEQLIWGITGKHSPV